MRGSDGLKYSGFFTFFFVARAAAFFAFLPGKFVVGRYVSVADEVTGEPRRPLGTSCHGDHWKSNGFSPSRHCYYVVICQSGLHARLPVCNFLFRFLLPCPLFAGCASYLPCVWANHWLSSAIFPALPLLLLRRDKV